MRLILLNVLSAHRIIRPNQQSAFSVGVVFVVVCAVFDGLVEMVGVVVKPSAGVVFIRVTVDSGSVTSVTITDSVVVMPSFSYELRKFKNTDPLAS